ncbi:hypothetical protein AB6A40_001455 [Gnathostoma spinigerum]|uniref:Uncharacterized protein n=1 Tax=Gnathostoma spinigerum TaxID=75299 RepID=A0ABD6E6G3_9BILA
MRFDCIEQPFASLLAKYAQLVTRYPWPFIVLPIVLTCFLSTGLTKHSDAFLKDNLDLYTPTDARSVYELHQIDRLFHINDSDPFFALRR